jgi:hypothetical protein
MSVIDTAIPTTGTTSTRSIDSTESSAHALEIVRWKDSIVERVGFDACGDYVELFWLPIIGPTSTWLLRRLAVIAVLHPDGFELDPTETARALGLGADVGPRSPFTKSLHRLATFGLVKAHHHRHEVRTVVPPLTLKHLARLPENLQCAHSLWAESDPSASYSHAFAGTAPTPESSSLDDPVDAVSVSAC